jgi:hypothetical protein
MDKSFGDKYFLPNNLFHSPGIFINDLTLTGPSRCGTTPSFRRPRSVSLFDSEVQKLEFDS